MTTTQPCQIQSSETPKIPLAVFRADTSAAIGGGHVMRCLALADALCEIGWECVFAGQRATAGFLKSQKWRGAEILVLDDDPASEATSMMQRWPEGCELLIVDHYQRDDRFERAFRPWARRIMVIDDLANRTHDCDLLLDQTAGRHAADYAPFIPPSCRLMLGAGYAMLRSEFAHARPRAVAARRRGGPVCRILVAFGASDPGDATSLVLRGIAETGIDVAIDVVLGEHAPHIAAVRRCIAGLPQTVTLHCAVSNMAELMCNATMAIGAAGTTSWERCCLGLPTVTIVTADNQKFVGAALDDAGAIRLLGRAEDLTGTEIGAAVTLLATDSVARIAMAEQAAALCDGRGLERVILALAAPCDGLWLRLASPEDSPMLFDWQCHPDTRRFARNPAAPTRDEHDGWMARISLDAGIMLMIVMNGDEPVGVLRLDTVSGSLEREISIYVAPERYGQGIAGAALQLARTIYANWTFHAEVLADNRASHALFQAAGYRKLSATQYICEPIMATIN